jgi:hypothetical protein
MIGVSPEHAGGVQGMTSPYASFHNDCPIMPLKSPPSIADVGTVAPPLFNRQSTC